MRSTTAAGGMQVSTILLTIILWNKQQRAMRATRNAIDAFKEGF